MKIVKFSALFFSFCLSVVAVQAQTADEIVTKHINAVGGKDKINNVKSLYMEGVMDVMGNEAPITISMVNGKGYKSEVEFNGQKIVQAYNDKNGWMINPMMGSSDPQPIPDEQYKMGKEQIYIGGAFLDYAAKGTKVELLGKEKVGEADAFKLKVTTADNAESTYYIDPATFYVLKVSRQMEMGGQQGQVDVAFSDYKATDAGYVMPYTVETTMPQGFTLNATIKKVEVNKDIDLKTFEMPK
jgi:outer membrane lipoprotein-sorting protein